MNRLLRELRQRGVFRAAALYIALIWLLLQIADVVFPVFDVSDSATRSYRDARDRLESLNP